MLISGKLTCRKPAEDKMDYASISSSYKCMGGYKQ